MKQTKPTARYPWESAMRDMALALAEREPSPEEFARLWTGLGDIVWYLVKHDPRQAEPFDEADGMCPNCCTPWKCNGPHLSEQTAWARQQARP
jgi:hypothetical protein